MTEVLISIVIPIYNVDRYLDECLYSIQSQSFRNLEIIMINDGSTDSSLDICAKYLELDKRFRLITQENAGLSASRNRGIENATGEFICFIDADDSIDVEYIEVLYRNLLEFEADVSMCSYSKNREYEKGENNHSLLERLDILERISTTGPENQSEAMVVTWNKLFARKIFDNLRFPIRIHEDEFMIQEYLLRAKQIVWTDQKLYYYRQREDSLTGLRNRYSFKHLETLRAVKGRIEVFTGPQYKKVFNKLVTSYFENAIIWCYILKDGHSRLSVKCKIYPQYLQMLFGYHKFLSRGQKKKYLQFLLSPNYYWKTYWR